MENVKNFWDTCDTAFSHIEIKKHLKNYNTLTSQWEKAFIPLLDWKNKSVVDYGIGGGWLGKYLFETKNIDKYIGIDISQRSLDNAKINLFNFRNNVLLFLTNDIDLSSLRADIFVCQACIQHFPDMDYLEKFLCSLNNSSCFKLMLQIANSPKTIFNNSNYKSITDVVRACKTNKEYVSEKLNNYNLEYYSEIYPNDYQFLIFNKI